MVIAGVVIDQEQEELLRKIGVKDSKILKPKKREELAKKIEKIARNVVVLRVNACKIDSYRAEKINLDMIEAMKMGDIINICDFDRFYIDAISANAKRFKSMIVEHLSNRDADLVVENYADETYPVVSAASIIAKVERDKVIGEIKRQEGVDFGVGYSHDERSVKFVENLLKEGKELPNFVRKSWITTQVLQENNWQKKMKDFIKGKVRI